LIKSPGTNDERSDLLVINVLRPFKGDGAGYAIERFRELLLAFLHLTIRLDDHSKTTRSSIDGDGAE
jgi:hypothetical protein